MNYFKHYENLIHRAQKRQQIHGYKEKHHVWPRCLGGPDEKRNLVLLTAEEHYVAHQLLIKMFPDEQGLVWAACKMTYSGNGQVRNNKLYKWVREKHQHNAKARTGYKNGSYGKKWFYNPETMESKLLKPENVPNGWLEGRKQRQVNNPIKWFHDPKTGTNKKFPKFDAPKGWVEGKFKFQENVNVILSEHDATDDDEITLKKHALRRVIRDVLKVNVPRWRHVKELREMMEKHVFEENLSSNDIKLLYGLNSPKRFDMFLSKSLNIDISHMKK